MIPRFHKGFQRIPVFLHRNTNVGYPRAGSETDCEEQTAKKRIAEHQMQAGFGGTDDDRQGIPEGAGARGETASMPLILTLDMHGVPHRWVTWQHACFYHARGRVAWSMGARAFTIYGGLSRLTGARSSLSSSSIIAIAGKAMAMKTFQQVPPLNNRELFHRDRYLCGYCGVRLPAARLTRDHIKPFSRGGIDAWMNVVTACRSCNERKGDRLPEAAGMELLYAPYVPNRAEYLILTNRRILADQMEFLAQHVPAQSRLHTA